MLPVQLNSSISFAFLYHPVFLDSLVANLIKRIQEIAIATFSKTYELFRLFNQQSNENNLKTFALISCLSLIALLIISMLQRHDLHIISSSKPENVNEKLINATEYACLNDP